MWLILIGVVAFGFGILFDFISLKNWPYAKTACWIGLSCLFVIAHAAVAFHPDKMSLPGWARMLGWVLFLAGFFLLFYSLFAEIPLVQTYSGHTERRMLVQEGSYALTRHPGVLWYALALGGLVLASASRLALTAWPIWVACDVLWVWIEDRFVFDRLFEEYDAYRQATPMLIPTIRSVKRFWRTFPLRRMLAGSRDDRRATEKS